MVDQQGEEMKIQAKEVFQEPEYDQLKEALPGTKDKCQVPGKSESAKAGTQSVMRENHLLGECLKGKVIHERGNNLFNWFNLKLSQCMSATWINGTQNGEINTLDSRDLTEHTLMMEKSSRDSHDTKGSKIQGKSHKDTSLVSPTPISYSFFFFAHKHTESPHISSTSFVVSLSYRVFHKHYSHTVINPLKLFTTVDLELDDFLSASK